jgi:predicted nucleic acid-binding protein
MIFDSDVLIWFLRGDSGAGTLIDSIPDRALSIVTLMEVQQGAKSKAEMRMARELFRERAFRIIPLTESIGHIAAGLIEEYALSSGLRLEDALIAATVREAGETLATGNIRHFRPIANLELRPFRPGPAR